jgi:hypothetical protein
MEWIFILTAYVAGLGAARATLLDRSGSPYLVSAAALGFGVGMQVVLFIAMILTHFPMKSMPVAGLQAAMAAASVILSLLMRRGSLGEWACHGLTLLAILLIDLALAKYNILTFTPDSLYSHYSTLKIVTYGNFDFDLAPTFMSAFPVAGAGMHYAAVLKGSEYFPGVYPALAFSLVMMTACLAQRMLADAGLGRVTGAILGLVIALVAMGSGMMVWVSIYFNNHIHAAVLFMIAAASFWLAAREGTGRPLLGAVLAMALFTLDRMEGPVFGLLTILVLASAVPPALSHHVRAAIVLFAVLSIPWQLFLTGIAGKGGLIGRNQFFGMAAILSIAALAAIVVPRRWLHGLLGHLGEITCAGLVLLILAFFAVNPMHMFKGTTALLANWFYKGYWTGTWLLLAGGSAWVWVRRPQVGMVRDRALDALFFAFLAYALLVVAFNGVRIERDVYLVGYGNSSNRMMTHVVPVGMLWLGIHLSLLSASAARRWHEGLRAFAAGPRLDRGNQ